MHILKIGAIGLVLAALTPHAAAQGRGEHWVGTWATADTWRPAPGPAPAGQTAAPRPLNFNNQTLRQIVHTSIAGERVRVVLSNAFGTAPLTIGAASLGLLERESTVKAGSAKPMLF
jgi:hypothetical protein